MTQDYDICKHCMVLFCFFNFRWSCESTEVLSLSCLSDVLFVRLGWYCRCVLKMDHHCPWIANCVGYHNHRYFVLYLMYLWIGTGYGMLIGFYPFLNASDMSMPYQGYLSREVIIFTYLLTMGVFVAIFILFSWQVFLVLSNQTTPEFYVNKLIQWTV